MNMVDCAKLKGSIVAKGFTQEKIAEKLGLSTTAFSNKVTNKTEFKASEISKIRDLLCLTYDELSSIFFAK